MKMQIHAWEQRVRKRRSIRAMTRAEVALHSTAVDCWIVLRGKVFDVTEFILFHPRVIAEFAGKDATAAFEKAHAYVGYAAVLSHEQVGFVTD